MKALRDLLLSELASILDAEKRFAQAFPALEKAATSIHLKRALRTQTRDATSNAAKLESVFLLFGAAIPTRPCETTIAWLNETDQLIDAFKGSPALDAALIAATQKTCHHKIVAFGCLHEWSDDLGNKPATGLLADLLESADNADQNLTRLAREYCNEPAVGETDIFPAAAFTTTAVRRHVLGTPRLAR